VWPGPCNSSGRLACKGSLRGGVRGGGLGGVGGPQGNSGKGSGQPQGSPATWHRTVGHGEGRRRLGGQVECGRATETFGTRVVRCGCNKLVFYREKEKGLWAVLGFSTRFSLRQTVLISFPIAPFFPNGLRRRWHRDVCFGTDGHVRRGLGLRGWWRRKGGRWETATQAPPPPLLLGPCRKTPFDRGGCSRVVMTDIVSAVLTLPPVPPARGTSVCPCSLAGMSVRDAPGLSGSSWPVVPAPGARDSDPRAKPAKWGGTFTAGKRGHVP